MKVKIYSTPSCPYCEQVKDYLSSKNIAFQEIDVSQDQKSGQTGVPLTEINNHFIKGFSPQEIDQVLQQAVDN